MNIRTGIDIVKISRIENAINKSGDTFLQKHFHLDEYKNKSVQTIAGLWAAKEAIIKALDLSADSWLNIKIIYADSGNPSFAYSENNLDSSIESRDLSISHTDNFAVGCVVVLLSEDLN